MRLISLALMASAIGSAAAAPPLTVDEAVRSALLAHPRVHAAAADLRAARAGSRAAGALANPEVTVTPGLSPGGSDEEFSVRQPLELNGSRAARAGAAAARERAVAAALTAALQETAYAAKAAYYELVRAREGLLLARDLVRNSEELDRITRRQVELGSRPGIDQTQTGIELSRAQQQEREAAAQAGIAAAALNAAMGQPADAALGELAALPPASVSAPIDRQSALRSALAHRAELAAAAAERDALRCETRLARAEGLPDISAQYRATRIVGRLDDAGISVSLTLPFVDLGGRRHRVRQAEEAVRAQEARTDASAAQVRLEVDQAVTRALAAGEIVRGYEQGMIEQSRRLLAAARTGFEAGRTTVLAVLDSQRTYRSVQSEYSGAMLNRALALAELERATGALAARLPDGAPAVGKGNR